MKRQDCNTQIETGGKRQKLEMEEDNITSETIREENVDENDTEESIDVKPLNQEDDLETDGEREQCTNKACKIYRERDNDETKPKLEAGFGFDKDTAQFRISKKSRPIAHKVQLVSTVSKAKESTKHREKATAANSISQECEKKNEVNPCNTQGKDNDPGDNHKDDADEPETDALYPKQLEEWKMPSKPDEVPKDFADMSKMTLKRQKPDQQTKILIPHKYADKPEGDEFGVEIRTYTECLEHNKIYYRHFFKKVEPNQPASEMKIRDSDELVMVNDVFVPLLKHTAVLNLFHHVKVDGKTRLSLVIRRKQSKHKWEWIETSAILAPEREEDTPAVTDLCYKEVEGDKSIERPMSKHFYEIPGTGKYIDVCDGQALIGIMDASNNKTKIIWKRTKYWQVDTEGHITFASTLCDVTKHWFIAIDPNDQIVVQRDPLWFKIFKVGSKVRFQHDKLYIGYDLENNKLKAQVTDCLFEEFPVPSVDTVDDISASQKVDPLIEEGQNNAHQNIQKSSLHINVCLPYPNPINSSDVSSLSSADSGTGSITFDHSSSSGTSNSDRQSMISSQMSVSSGYMSSSPESMDNNPGDVWKKAPTDRFPWCSHFAPVSTPTTLFETMNLTESELD